MSRWFRHYAGMMRDEKLVRAAMKASQPVERVVWVWGAILESAAEINDGGRYDFDAAEAGYFLRSSPDDIQSIVDALVSLGRLDNGVVAKWGDRQFESDSGAERQRRYRDRQKPHRDGGVTAADRNGDGGVTPPENIDIDIDRKKESRASARSDREKIADEFEEWYQAYPLHKGRNAAFKVYKRITTSEPTAVPASILLDAAKAYARQCAGKDKQFIAHPATWLNQGRWLDDDLQPPKPQEPVSNGRVWVGYGTDAGDAWEDHYRKILGKPPPGTATGGYYFPSQFPPDMAHVKQSLPAPSPTEKAA